jgi:small-conductance mechanosensitive channel
VKNSEKIDRTFEKAVNIVFYTVLAIVIVTQLGYDPLTIFASVSALTLALAWMIGSASAKMFEGFLFILVRRPVSGDTSMYKVFDTTGFC